MPKRTKGTAVDQEYIPDATVQCQQFSADPSYTEGGDVQSHQPG